MAENDTFGYWRRNWLKIKKTEASAKWYESCEIYAGKLADLENVKVSKLRAMDLQSLLIDMSLEKNQSGKYYSERTLKITRDIAREILDMVVDNRVIEYNPFSRVKLPKAQRAGKAPSADCSSAGMDLQHAAPRAAPRDDNDVRGAQTGRTSRADMAGY